MGVGAGVSRRDIREFVGFMERGKLMDVTLRGRKFTRYKEGGECKSRIDRALINEKWASMWSDTELRGLPRTISDHCGLVGLGRSL